MSVAVSETPRPGARSFLRISDSSENYCSGRRPAPEAAADRKQRGSGERNARSRGALLNKRPVILMLQTFILYGVNPLMLL